MPNLGKDFYSKLVSIASDLSMKPEDILAIMVSESGINPGAQEKEFKGGGLIGFMPQTQKNLGFKGSPDDFIRLSGTDQLDYVKRYIEGQMKTNGGPFKSAAQYYVANFFPVALKLPGIRAEDPETVFVEEHPRTVKDKNGSVWSKKYFDIGIKLPPSVETSAYQKNKLFHGNVPGAINYGDMMRQVDKNKQSSTYRNAVAQMKTETGYTSKPGQEVAQTHTDTSFLGKLTKMIKQFVFATQEPNKFLIVIGSSRDHSASLEYANVLATALEEYLQAKTSIHHDQSNVEIACRLSGDKKVLFAAIKELSLGISDAFETATSGITTFATITADHSSDYELLHPRLADLNHRKFKLQLARTSK